VLYSTFGDGLHPATFRNGGDEDAEEEEPCLGGHWTGSGWWHRPSLVAHVYEHLSLSEDSPPVPPKDRLLALHHIVHRLELALVQYEDAIVGNQATVNIGRLTSRYANAEEDCGWRPRCSFTCHACLRQLAGNLHFQDQRSDAIEFTLEWVS
jgi:hypothetical protein